MTREYCESGLYGCIERCNVGVVCTEFDGYVVNVLFID